MRINNSLCVGVPKCIDKSTVAFQMDAEGEALGFKNPAEETGERLRVFR